ncbi:MAG: PilT/PilU family type 4a pilus ATPase [Endozoicomonas sp.]
MNVKDALRLATERNGSDLYVTVGYPLSMKVNNNIISISKIPLTAGQVNQAIQALMSKERFQEFCISKESSFSTQLDGTGRFRVSAFYQKGEPGMVVRRINTDIPTLEQLGLPQQVGDHVLNERGLILFVGAAGSGKTTSLAALIGHRNQKGSGHIITIEDPIEYVHNHDKCIVTQRDVGVDTNSYEAALQNALRQSPDVVVIGEIRSAELMRHTIEFVETGHLCIATLHANNTYQALERVVNFFPNNMTNQILMDLSLSMRAIIGQQLIPSKNQDRVYPALEIMFNTPRIADLIKRGAIDELNEAIHKSREQGMQTFDHALYDLYKAGKISYDSALLHATSTNNLRLMLKMEGENPPVQNKGNSISTLNIVSDDDQ